MPAEVTKLQLFIFCNIEVKTNLDVGVMQMGHILLTPLFIREEGVDW